MSSERSNGSDASAGDRLLFGAFITALVFVGFLGGAWVMLSTTFPHAYLETAYRGGMALWRQQTQYVERQNIDFWAVARTPTRGVSINQPRRTFPGPTLYTSGHGARAFLIAMDGEVVHEWHLPYSAVWDETAAVDDPQPDTHIYWRKARVLPNGDLLAIYLAAGDGRVYALTHEISQDVKEGYAHLKPPRLDDYVVVLSPTGEELRRVSVLDAVIRSPYARRLSRIAWYTRKSGDYLHTNAIDVIDAEQARSLPFVEAGQVLISFRELDMIAVLDLDSEKLVWALRGSWFSQHDPDILPGGRMLLFDNLGHFAQAGGTSRLLEFDPTTGGVIWQYAGTAETPFDSDVRSAQQRLPNGNTLITESTGGRIFEITRSCEIVWEYINPVRMGPVETPHPGKKDRVLIPIVSWAQRIDPASLEADFREQVWQGEKR